MSRVLVVGLDGGTFDVLSPLMDRGLMPNLSAVRDGGVWGPLASTMPPFTASAWSTFITGQNPGQHGIISFNTRDAYNYDVKGSGFVNATRLNRTLWDLIGEAGKRMSVVNVPMTYPAKPISGNMVTGMLTPPGADFTYPDTLAAKLGAGYIVDLDFIRDDDQFRLQNIPGKMEIISQLKEMATARTAACLKLMEDEPWSFFMVVYTGTDRIFHFFWDELTRIMDGEGSEFEDHLLSYFQELDGHVGSLMERCDPESTTFIVSDHGFGAAPTRRFFVNRWLEQLGLLNQRPNKGMLDAEYWRVRIGRNRRLKSLLRRFVPESTQKTVQSISESMSGGIVDWSTSEAYFVPIYFHVCGIEINLEGERASGIVSRGESYERIRARIIREAGALIDPGTKQRIVRSAARREDIYQGDSAANFPDIIIELDPDYIGAGSLAGEALFEPHVQSIRTGEHRQEGVFLARGNSIRKRDGQLTDLRLLDVPATILYALDLPVPYQFDGRVLTEVFREPFLASQPLRYVDDQEYAAGEQIDELTPEQQRELENRLRGLGYLE